MYIFIYPRWSITKLIFNQIYQYQKFATLGRILESTKHYSQQLNIRLTKYWRWLRWRLSWRQKKRPYFRWKILENMSFIMIFKYLLLIRKKSNYQYHKKKIIHFKRINFNDWNFLKCLKYEHLSKNLLKKVVQI